MNIVRTSTRAGTCLLTLDRPESPTNRFDRGTLEELDAHLASVESAPEVGGLILLSAKTETFAADADLAEFARDANDAELAELIDLGQQVFARVSRLAVPSVAAIHGACLFGGLELALACDWRVATLGRPTTLGFPETRFGVLPAWGGSNRLPKLIGLPAALGLLATGRQVAADHAQKLGLIDEAVHREHLLKAAEEFIGKGKRPAARPRHMSRVPLNLIVAAKAHVCLRLKTRRHYPAPSKAIETCARSAPKPVEAGLALEKQAFLALVRTPACRHLLEAHFMRDRAQKQPMVGTTDAVPPIARALVVGAGTMGTGIAQWISSRGISVRLKDVTPDALGRGMKAVGSIYARAVESGELTAAEVTAGLDRIMPLHTDVPFGDVDFVIESTLERLDVKQQVFRDIEQRVGTDAVLATNASALSIDAIAAALKQPERLVGMHFITPVHRMPLVEIVRGARTSPTAVAAAVQCARKLGKVPVIVKDRPGFLVNRIVVPYIVEALWLFTQGISATRIDRLMRRFGMPVGPLQLADEMGFDVVHHLAKDLERRLPRGVPPINDTLEKMIAKGWLGKKSSRGFYVYKGKSQYAMPQSDLRFLQAQKPRACDSATLQDRLVLVMINEAARVLADGVVETPEELDFGLVIGAGWAPFRGGPLRHADTIGAGEIVRRLEGLANKVAPHFSPCQRLEEMARHDRLFFPPLVLESPPVAPAPSAPIETLAAATASVDEPLTRSELQDPAAGADSSAPEESTESELPALPRLPRESAVAE